jgi:hypothetical protein
MDARLQQFIEQVVQDIVGLELVLFFQAHPNVLDTPTGIAMRVGRTTKEVEGPLQRLAQAGILEVQYLGAGRYSCYSLNRTPEVWDLVCRLSEAYLYDDAARREIILLLVQHSRPSASQPS